MSTNYCTGVQGHAVITSNLARTERFLTDDLGLRVRKRTVHHNNEALAVAYFGFNTGDATTDEESVCYVEWAPVFYALPAAGLISAESARGATVRPEIGDPKGRWGAGTNHHLAFHVPDRKGLLKWKRRLSDRGHLVTGPYFRNYFHAIYFRDPDGSIVEIATTEPGFGHDEEQLGSGHRRPPEEALVGVRSEFDVASETWPEPIAGITDDMALSGFHHITSVCTDADTTTRFYVDLVGLDLIKKTDYLDANGTHYYYSAGPQVEPGSIITFFGFPNFPRGRVGVGLAHHFALRARDDDALASWHEDLRRKTVDVGPIQDHVYFKAFYLTDPDGHILSVSTPPRFDIDESPSQLGQKLCLPPSFERRRAEIERVLKLHPAPSANASDVAVAAGPAR